MIPPSATLHGVVFHFFAASRGGSVAGPRQTGPWWGRRALTQINPPPIMRGLTSEVSIPPECVHERRCHPNRPRHRRQAGTGA